MTFYLIAAAPTQVFLAGFVTHYVEPVTLMTLRVRLEGVENCH